jgi:hypothetical protein
MQVVLLVLAFMLVVLRDYLSYYSLPVLKQLSTTMFRINKLAFMPTYHNIHHYVGNQQLAGLNPENTVHLCN